MKLVMFICSGNVNRSFLAASCLRDVLQKRNIDDYLISSAGFYADAGTEADSHAVQALQDHGISVIYHRSQLYTPQLAQLDGLHVSMGVNVQRYIHEDFGRCVPLFNEIAYGESTSVKDYCDYQYPDFKAIATATVEHILNGMDTFVRRMPEYFSR